LVKKPDFSAEFLRDNPLIAEALKHPGAFTVRSDPSDPDSHIEQYVPEPAPPRRPGRRSRAERTGPPELQMTFNQPLAYRGLAERTRALDARRRKQVAGGLKGATARKAAWAKTKEKAKKLAISIWQTEKGLQQIDLAAAIRSKCPGGKKPSVSTLVGWISEWQSDGTLQK
jgi:hypothetical protein